jgi:hypothetical protein
MPSVRRAAVGKGHGAGLGATNFCCRARVGKGLVEMQNFSQNRELRSAHSATLAVEVGMSKLTVEFRKRNVAEYETPRAEIEKLRTHVNFMKDLKQ